MKLRVSSTWTWAVWAAAVSAAVAESTAPDEAGGARPVAGHHHHPAAAAASAAGHAAAHPHSHLREPGHHHRHRHEAQGQPHHGVVAHHQAAASGLEPRQVQREIEKMALRADKLAAADRSAAAEVDGALEDVEAALASRAGADAGLEDEIQVVRADLCAKHGFESHERADCEAFMRKACIHKKHGSKKHHQVAELQEDDKPDMMNKAKETHRLEGADADFVSDDNEFDVVAGASGEESKAEEVPEVPMMLCRHFFREVAATERKVQDGPAPAAATAAAPAPAPADVMPFVPAPAPAPPAGPWFQHDPEQGLRENGVDGPLVDHDDQETQTADWQREFGPNAKHRSLRDICRDHPDNEWCRIHMAGRRSHIEGMPGGWAPRSSAHQAGAGAALCTAAAALWATGLLCAPAA